jgi:hypothetical protein
VATVPDSYEERLTEIFPGTFEHLRLLALDQYDLALSKLERNTQRDRDDVWRLITEEDATSFAKYTSRCDHFATGATRLLVG